MKTKDEGVKGLLAGHWSGGLVGVKIGIADMEERHVLFPTKTEIIL